MTYKSSDWFYCMHPTMWQLIKQKNFDQFSSLVLGWPLIFNIVLVLNFKYKLNFKVIMHLCSVNLASSGIAQRKIKYMTDMDL